MSKCEKKCKDCMHFEACLSFWDSDYGIGTFEENKKKFGEHEKCAIFKEKSLFVELPCKVGDKMYFVCGSNIAEYEVYKIEYDLNFFRLYGENSNYVIEHREFVCLYPNPSRTIFFTKEEAERKLKEVGV